MAISTKERRRLPASAFVYPSVKKYPINTKRRARAALRFSARRDTYGSYATVSRKVFRRYPDLKPKRKRKSTSRKRRR